MEVGLLTGLLFAGIILFLITGLPVAFVLGGVAIIFTFITWGTNGLSILATSAWSGMSNFVIVSVPLFIYMGVMLERSGVASALYTMMHRWAGALRGGLAAGTVFICMIFAAMTGLSGASTVALGLVALPEMLKRGYSKDLAIGSIGAGGALGILIPPSATMIIYALIAEQSVGQLFIGGVFPGIMLGGMFIVYILIRSGIQKNLAPSIPKEERASLKEKVVSTKAVILPLLIILAVLGSIFAGIATPTEAAAVGALGATLSAAVYRKLNWESIKYACYSTLKVSAMALWIFLGSTAFTTVYYAMGATEFVSELLLSIPGGPIWVILAMQLIWLILGCLLDPWGIIMITCPIFVPVVAALGYDLVWFGVVLIVNMEMAYLTPPFGMNLFYLKGVAPKGVTMGDIYHSVTPFVLLQLAGLMLVVFFPAIATWLPNLIFSLR